MGILAPFSFAFRTFNTIGNVWLAGQVSWWVYKEVRTMQKEKLNADKLKEKFIADYTRQFGMKPTDEMISVALESYNAVERPIQHRFNKAKDGAVKQVSFVKDKAVEGTNYATERIADGVKITQEMVVEGVRELVLTWKESRDKHWANTGSDAESVHAGSGNASKRTDD
jgi:hypothetical protein